MSSSSLYTSELRTRGYRMTPQRMTILHILHHSGKHLSPGEVYRQAIKELPGVTEPTIYRTLEFLAENDLVHVSHSATGHLTYQISGENHDHIVCRICGDEVEVDHRLLGRLYRSLESTSGYVRINSHVTFFGVCPECQKP
jgi:Fe2+ or Zn2+ uptake regulation protein